MGTRPDGYEFLVFFQAEDGIRDIGVTGVQTCALPIFDLNVKETERTLLFSRRGNGDNMLEGLPWGNTGSEVTLVSGGNVLPVALDTSYEIGRASCRERV